MGRFRVMGTRIGYGALLLGILAWMFWKDFFQVAIVCGILAMGWGLAIIGEIKGFDSRVHGKLAEDQRARDAKRRIEAQGSKRSGRPGPT